MSTGEQKTFSFKVNVLPFIVATLGEFTALYFWLWFFREEQYLLAVVILLAGFLAERIAVLYWVSQVFGAEVGITGSKKTPRPEGDRPAHDHGVRDHRLVDLVLRRSRPRPHHGSNLTRSFSPRHS